VQQLAERLGIPYVPKAPATPKSATALKQPIQSEVFKQMEILRIKMRSLPARPDIDISLIANEVNAK
jgi:hypothetical protein